MDYLILENEHNTLIEKAFRSRGFNQEEARAAAEIAAIPAVTAALAPLLWSGSNKTAMLVPASVIATTLLPIAYLIFILLINSKKTLGDSILTGGRKIMVNVLLMIGLGLATFASFWALSGKKQSVFGTALEAGQLGMICLGILAIVGVVGFVKNNRASN